MKWVDALKIWNSGKDKWCVPRKNSTEYEEVRAIMRGENVEDYTSVQPAISRRQAILDALKMELAQAESMMAGISGKRKERGAVKIQALVRGVMTREKVLKPLLYKKALEESIAKAKERRRVSQMAYARPKTPMAPPPPPPSSRPINPLNPLTPSPPPKAPEKLFERRVYKRPDTNLKPAKMTVNELGEIVRPQSKSLTYEVRRNIEERLMSNEPLFNRPMTALNPRGKLAPIRTPSAVQRQKEAEFVRGLQGRPMTAPANLGAVRAPARRPFP